MPFDDLGPQLARWLPEQRWYQGKDRALQAVEVADVARLSEGLVIVLARVRTDAGAELYSVPLAPRDGGPLTADGRAWDDALRAPHAVRLLAERACVTEHTTTRGGGRVTGWPVTGLRPRAGAGVRTVAGEQSNTSAVLDEGWILKVLRRIEAGVHPDIELTAALTTAGFPHVPPQHGSLQLLPPGGEGSPTALAVLSTFAAGADEGWTLATSERRDELLPHLPDLGAAVAGLHRTLAHALPSRAVDAGDRGRWVGGMLSQLAQVLATAGLRAPDVTAEVRARASELRAAFTDVVDLEDAGTLVRIHGDLHLGQVLLAPDGHWLLLDFEGEPVRPLAERRAPGSPLRDVAGLLRSLDYAAAAPHDGRVPPTARTWRAAARARFLEGYVAEGAQLLPSEPSRRRLLTAWELDKAVYELGYELANRPSWVPIPAMGILRLLDALRPA